MSMSEPEPLEKSEADAIDDAVSQVAELLKDGKSLDMIEQHIYRMRRKKDMVETRLKEAVEAQLRGVRTGLFNLQKVMREANDICTSMKNVNSMYTDLTKQLGDNAKEIRDTRVVHREHALLNSYLQNIYNFKEDVKQAQEYLSLDELLPAHEILMKLEDCRDGIYKEVMNEQTDAEKREKVEDFFSGLKDLNKDFTKKIQFFLNKALPSIRAGKTSKLVSILRIIEREEKKDFIIEQSNGNLAFPGRPKKWRELAQETLEKTIADTFEGLWELNQEDEGWVLKFSQKIKILTQNDLQVVDQHLQQCFPPSWHILDFYCSHYQRNIRLRFEEIIKTIQSSEGQASSYIIVFNWSNVLNNIMKRHRTSDKYERILTPDHIHTLVQCYTERLEYELSKQTDKILKQERDGRYELNKFPDGEYYHTITPVIFYEMINQNLQFAFNLESKMELIPVLQQLDSKIKFFIEQYVVDLREFKDKYFETPDDDREDMKYVEWLIASCNNAVKCASLNDELVVSLTKQDKDKDISSGSLLEKETMIANKGDLFKAHMLRNTCELFADLVFSDLRPIIDLKLFTTEWDSKCLMQILVTIDDYNQSYFGLIDKIGYTMVLEVISERLLLEYLVALFNTKSLSMSPEQFKNLLLEDHEKICEFFSNTLGINSPEEQYECLKSIGELVSETDDLVQIAMADFVNNFPDIQYDQCVALLALRGDMNSKEIRDTVSSNGISETAPVEVPYNSTIFSLVHQVTGPLSSRFFQTVVAPRTVGFRAPAVNLNTSVAAGTTSFSKIGSNISTAISNSPVYHAINQAWNEKDQLPSKAVRALDFSNVDTAERTNPFSDDPRDGKGPAPRPPPKKKGPAPLPPSKTNTNPFDDDDD